jgi:pSer/pThr/pTyr-binding forkhead associated (FHA) protein
VLNGDVVVGRNPSGHERVRSGAAAPLVVTDSERSVSRSHAELLVQGWSVHLRDLGSPNGTSVRLPSSPRHETVPTGEVIALLPGTEITMGRRAMTLLT